MKFEISNDGVGVFEGYFSSEYCASLIKAFEWSEENLLTWGRDEDNGTVKNDTSTCLAYTNDSFSNQLKEFNIGFWDNAYPEYIKCFSVLNDISRHGIHTHKIQKTLPTQGYHVWHCEQDSRERGQRIAAYALYLNDVEEGGETEFLYLSKRIKPQTGKLVIFPSGYLHTHRGNPPLSGTKYIMTGWLEFM